MLNKLFDDWYDSLPDGEPTYQQTFEAGQQASVCKLTQLQEFSKQCGIVMNEAYLVLENVEGEDSYECECINNVLNSLRDLVRQAYVHNNVMSDSQLKRISGGR
jgi:hypothetical protein